MKTSDVFVNVPTHYCDYTFIFCICCSFSEIPSVLGLVQTCGQIYVSVSETKGLSSYLTLASIPKPGFSHAVLDTSYPY